MDHTYFVQQLETNKSIFQSMLQGLPEKVYLWKQNPEKWCLLEIVRHLIDEEVEDFRARTRSILDDPNQDFSPIDPVGWVKSRDYIGQDYDQSVQRWIEEREASVEWLKSLTDPQWGNTYHHQTLGDMSAWKFLSNWLAHDYLHFRQISRLKYDYTAHISGEDISYAGNWI